MAYSWGFLFFAPHADPAKDRFVIDRDGVRGVLVAVPNMEAAAKVAIEFAGSNARFIELCGAFGHLGVAKLIDATSGQIPVALCTRDEGSQFLWQTRSKFRSFNFYDPGLKFSWTYLFLAPKADPTKDRFVFEHEGLRTTLVAAPDPSVAAQVAIEMVDSGIQFIELCGGFGHRGVAKIIDAIDGRVVVSVATVASESSQKLAAMSAAANSNR